MLLYKITSFYSTNQRDCSITRAQRAVSTQCSHSVHTPYTEMHETLPAIRQTDTWSHVKNYLQSFTWNSLSACEENKILKVCVMKTKHLPCNCMLVMNQPQHSVIQEDQMYMQNVISNEHVLTNHGTAWHMLFVQH